MTTTRLSPAASLLRSSKLFAIPPAVTLPPPQASSEPVPRPTTATTIHPLRAAIETPLSSFNKGDWGLKRNLPVKTTTRTKTQSIRYQGGIDTREHTADFESAADHVLSLRKFQELNQNIRLPSTNLSPSFDARTLSVFSQRNDNTTTLQSLGDGQSSISNWPNTGKSLQQSRMPEHLKSSLLEYNKSREIEGQEPQTGPAFRFPIKSTETRRWRFDGPWLAGLTDLEFDAYLRKITPAQRAGFIARVKEHMRLKQEEKLKFDAQERGQAVDFVNNPVQISDVEAVEYMRRLRGRPREFGPLIADFFDLPEGPKSQEALSRTEPWEYGRDSIAAEPYRETGPPRTHPSAGLSYVQTVKFSPNDAIHGPQLEKKPAPARILKVRQVPGRSALVSVGVGGFVAVPPTAAGIKDSRFEGFAPVKGGRKMVARPTHAFVRQDGSLELGIALRNDYHLDEDLPVRNEDRRETKQQLPAIAGYEGGRMPELTRRFSQKADRSAKKESADKEMNDLLGMLSGSIPRST